MVAVSTRPASASLIIATIATGMIYLDQNAVNIVLPAIQRDLGIALNDMQWILNVYILFTTAPLLLFGVLGDRLGRVLIYKIGMILFGIGSLSCGLAHSFEWLIVFRGLQGIGASMIAAVGLAILHYHSPPEKRGQMLGSWATMTTMIIALGPAIAGAITEWFHWQLLFLVNLPFALLALWVAFFHVPENTSLHPASRISWISTLLLLFGMACLLFGIIEISRAGNSVIGMATLALIGVGLLTWFLFRQLRRSNALIPSEVFRYPRFVAINLLTLWQWLPIAGLFFLLPLHLQWTQGYSPLQTGLAMLPISMMIAFLSRSAGRYADKNGPYVPLLVGISCIAAGLGWLAYAPSIDDYWQELFPIMLLYGFGLAAVISPLTMVAMNSLPLRFSGIASGVSNSASRISSMLSVALVGSFIGLYFKPRWEQAVSRHDLPSSQHSVLLAQSDLLGNISLASISDLSIRSELDAARNNLIDAGFSWAMTACMLISLGSLLLVWRLNRVAGSSGRGFWGSASPE